MYSYDMHNRSSLYLCVKCASAFSVCGVLEDIHDALNWFKVGNIVYVNGTVVSNLYNKNREFFSMQYKIYLTFAEFVDVHPHLCIKLKELKYA